jgi:chorismate mutase
MAAELSLDALREEIDKIDEVIVRLLDRRARCAYAIGRLKRELGRAIYEPDREAFVMNRVREINAMLGGPLDGDAVARLYERIMDEARRIQRIEARRYEENLQKAAAQRTAGAAGNVKKD